LVVISSNCGARLWSEDRLFDLDSGGGDNDGFL
jgi:hypothetical protein